MQGKITNLGQQFDPDTRVMQVRIEVANTERPLAAGNAGQRGVSGRRGKADSTPFPADAVQQVNGQDVVFVRTAPDRFAVRPVRVGETADGNTPVLEGIKPGEQVAVRGSFILKSQLLKATLESE